jgi:hypothetical protein
MKTLFTTAAFVGLLITGTAYAAQTTLSDQQMDTVTAGVAPGCTRCAATIPVRPFDPTGGTVWHFGTGQLLGDTFGSRTINGPITCGASGC